MGKNFFSGIDWLVITSADKKKAMFVLEGEEANKWNRLYSCRQYKERSSWTIDFGLVNGTISTEWEQTNQNLLPWYCWEKYEWNTSGENHWIIQTLEYSYKERSKGSPFEPNHLVKGLWLINTQDLLLFNTYQPKSI